MKTTLIILCLLAVLVILAFIDQYFILKKKNLIKKSLFSIFYENKNKQMEGRELREELRKKGVKVGMFRFYYLMDQLRKEGIVTSDDYSDECGRLMMYRISSFPTFPSQKIESN